MKGNKMKKKILTSVLTMVAMNAQSGPLAVTTSPFSSGTYISSSAMNGKFQAIETYVNGSVCRSDGTNCLSNGSLLTNLNAGNISTGVLPLTNGGTGATSMAALRTSLNILWSVSGSSAFFNTGNVGIGTDTPNFPLTIENAANTGISLQSPTSGGGAGSAIDFRSNGLVNLIAKIRPVSSTPNGGDLWFQTSANGSALNTAMVIKKDGKIGIGTQNPSHSMSVYEPISAFTHYINSSTGSDANDGLVVGYYNNVAIINNFEDSNISFKIGGNEKMTITPNGNVNITGEVFSDGVILSSDVRLKKDFAPMKDVFEKLSTLEGYYFNWKDKSRPERQIGLKAQEVEKSFPEIVKTKKDGFKAVAYPQLVAPLIDAVNLLHKRVSVIEAPAVRTPASESRLQKLETENAQLKAWICAKDASAPFCRSTK